VRSPVPIPLVSEHAAQLWNEALEASPTAVKAKGNADAIDWARGALGSIRRKV